MRRITTTLLVLAAAGLSAQTTPSTTTTAESAPALITSTEVLPGDSPMVAAAKKAMAARQKAKDRIHVSVTPGKGHIFQATGPTNVSFKMPPEDPKPKPTKQAKPSVDAATLERRLQALILEQEKLGSHADEPMGGDGSEEDFVDKRITVLQKQIEDLRRQIAGLKGTKQQ
jgi:hypothetical protein